MRGAADESARRVSALLRKQPFFGSLALRLPLRADPSRETLASDGAEIRYNPGWAADAGVRLIETAIARVVLACALKHHARRGGREPRRGRRASQLVTHGLLREAGFILPPGAEEMEDIGIEEAYDRLPPEEDGDGPPSPQGGASGDGGRACGSTEDGNGPRDGTDGDGRGDGRADRAGDAGRQPQASPGGDPSSGDPAGTGEVMDAPEAGAPGFDRAAEEQVWDEAARQAASFAEAEGKLPGAVGETVRGARAARLDWRALLRRYLTDAARGDYSWSAPNRRFIDGGLYLPSIRSEGIETLAVIVDTSGSLPADILGEFWSELREIAAEIQPDRVIALQVDAAVRDVAEYAAFELPEEIEARGRGGTDFRPGFARLEERGVRPAVCLYFTDMKCARYPASEPPYPVLWMNWSDPPPDDRREPWGERIDIGAARH